MRQAYSALWRGKMNVPSKCTIVKALGKPAYRQVVQVGGRDESKDNIYKETCKERKINSQSL
jgi:hypothetical protein